jgi:hypothetical protein
MAPRVVLLGPQRHQPTLGQVVTELFPASREGGRIAAVTAGWEEREAEDQELSAHLWGRTVNLRLFERIERAFARDPELSAAFRARTDAVRAARELYRLRLAHALEAARELMRRAPASGLAALLEEERAEAIEAVRALDAGHAARVGAIDAEFYRRRRPLERASLAAERREVAELLGACSLLCVAGGNVAVLLNRLRLLGLAELVGGTPVIAWSAGAMALCERVVLFHDSPPQGAGNAEVLEAGLGLAPGVIALPHASRRLRLGDPLRVSLFARRFAPATPVALDPLARVDWDGRDWTAGPGAVRLCADGALAELAAA